MKMSIHELVAPKNDWFKVWFDSEFYRRLYSKRDDKEAEFFVQELIDELNPRQQASMLDLGCGNGRHAKHLAAKGFHVTGIDLAFSSIRQAKRWESETLQFHRHDMRIPFGKAAFDYVFNFFTSFGYFSHAENKMVMRNMVDALKPNGIVMIDFMNVAKVVKTLIAEEEKEIDGIFYRISRWTDEQYIYKKIAVDNLQDMQPFISTEKVVKFELNDFVKIFNDSGIRLIKVYGDYSLNPFDPNTSPRLIVMGEKSV